MSTDPSQPTPVAEIPVLTEEDRPYMVLTRYDDKEIHELLRKDTFNRCAPALKAFAECAANRTVSFLWACPEQKSAMELCLKRASTYQDMDRIQVQYIKDKRKRHQEQQQKQPANS